MKLVFAKITFCEVYEVPFEIVVERFSAVNATTDISTIGISYIW